MRLFDRLFGTRSKWQVLKLYSSVSVDKKVTVDRKILVGTLMQSFTEYFGEAPESFNISGPYGIRKGQDVGLKRFKTLLQSKGYDKFYDLTITNKRNSKIIEFLDTSDNLERKGGTYGYQELIIGYQILEQQIDLLKNINAIYEVFKFDYGYITDLPDNFDLSTESKIKRSFLTLEISVTASDLNWRSQIQLVLKGKLKDIYEVNILNLKQVENLNSNQLDMKYLNEQFYTWTIDKKEIGNFKSLLRDELLVNKIPNSRDTPAVEIMR